MINLDLRHRCYNFFTTGQLEYDPVRKGLKANNEYWAIINIDNDIAAYYRELFYQKYKIRLDRPSWDTHISVLKNYPQTNKDIPWKHRDGELTEVAYGNEMFWNSDHVWLNCHSELFFDIREHYNINTLDPNFRRSIDTGHITIGKFKSYQQNVLGKFGNYK